MFNRSQLSVEDVPNVAFKLLTLTVNDEAKLELPNVMTSSRAFYHVRICRSVSRPEMSEGQRLQLPTRVRQPKQRVQIG